MPKSKECSDFMAQIFGGGVGGSRKTSKSADSLFSGKSAPSRSAPKKSMPSSLFDNSNSDKWEKMIEERRSKNVKSFQEQRRKRESQPHNHRQVKDSAFVTNLQSSISSSDEVILSKRSSKGTRSNGDTDRNPSLNDVVLEIPPEFGTNIMTTSTNPVEYNDQMDTLNGVRRLFNRQADFMMREFGVLLLKKDENKRQMQQCTRGGAIFSEKQITSMRRAASRIQEDVVERLDATGKHWNATDVASKDDTDCNFSFYEVASRCLGRLDIRYGMDQPPFHSPEVIDNPWLMPVIQKLLGDSAKLVYCGLILSFPGSDDQPWHQDGHALFPEAAESNSLGTDLPPYALNVFVPLTDIDSSLGPTEFWLSSHKESQWKAVQHTLMANDGFPPREDKRIIRPLLQKGDVLIYDYRTCHRGTANANESAVRPMLYLMYARPWFAEHVNFGSERLFPQNSQSEKRSKTRSKEKDGPSAMDKKRSRDLKSFKLPKKKHKS